MNERTTIRINTETLPCGESMWGRGWNPVTDENEPHKGGQKVCSKCQEEKVMEEFYFHKGEPLAQCKTCVRKANRITKASSVRYRS